MHLDRLISVLETVAIAGRPVSPLELQQTTGLPRPTCYRLLQTLTDNRLLDDAGGSSRYMIGERLMRIALLGQSDMDVCQSAAPTLKDAAIEFGEAVFLSRFRGKSVEIIHVETPSDPSRSYVHPGLGIRPMHACSCSKAIAAFAEHSFQEKLLRGPLRAYTEYTKTSRSGIEKEFSEIRSRGYAECLEEIELGVASVAAPVRVGNIGATFSVGATGPVRRFNARYRKKIGQKLIDTSARVAAAIRLYEGHARDC